jgi:glycosyltransferase involved in cell wall biosynthesis
MKSSGPVITVMLPVRNGEPYLTEALESLLRQTYKRFRLLVVDDGSNDASSEIVASYQDSRITLLRQRETGVVESLNRMMAMADSEFIARQDADDISHPKRFERQLTFLCKNPQVGLLGTWADEIDSLGHIKGSMTNHQHHEDIVRCLPEYNQFVHGSVMMRRSACQNAGWYSPYFRHGEDYEYWFRLTKVTRAANLSQRLYFYRTHTDQIRSTQTEKQRCIREFIKRFSMDLASTVMVSRRFNRLPRQLVLLTGCQNLTETARHFAKTDICSEDMVQAYLAVSDWNDIKSHLPRAVGFFNPQKITLAGLLSESLVKFAISLSTKIRPNCTVEVKNQHIVATTASL